MVLVLTFAVRLCWLVCTSTFFILVLAACHSEKTPNWQYEGHGHVKITISLEGEIYELENGFRAASKRNDMINVGGTVGASWVPPLYKVLDDGRVILVVHEFRVPAWTKEMDDYHVVCRNETCSESRRSPIGVAVLDDATQPEVIKPYLLFGFGEKSSAYGGDIELLKVEVAAVREDTRTWPAAEVPWLAGAEELVRRGERTNGYDIAYANEEEKRRLRANWEQPNSSSFFEGQTFCLYVLHLASPRGWRPYASKDVPQLFSSARTHDGIHISGFSLGPIEPVPPTRTGIPWIDDELNEGDAFIMVDVNSEGEIGPVDNAFTRSACAFEWPEMENVDFGAYRLTPNNEKLPNTALADDASLYARFYPYRFGPEAFYGFGTSFIGRSARVFEQSYTGEAP